MSFNVHGPSITVALGDGAGALPEVVEFPADFYDVGLALADLDVDGNLDALISSQFSNVEVRLGDGLGGFAGGTAHPGGGHGVGLATLDLDADGQPDVVVGDALSSGLQVLRDYNVDYAEFSDSGILPTGKGPVFVAVGDLDGNGAPDLVTANREDDTVSVLLNQLVRHGLGV